MIKRTVNIKVILTLAFSMWLGITFASFGITDLGYGKIKDKDKGKVAAAKNDKYSIKNSHRPATFFSLSSPSTNMEQSPYDFGKMLFLNGVSSNLLPLESAGDNTDYINVNTTIRLKNGNTVIMYPYSYKVKADPFRFFKTPTAPTR